MVLKTRSIICFSYNGLASGFNDLDIDIKLKSKNDPKTTIYVVVYSVKGNVNNVSVGLWDRLYYYNNDSIEYEVPIDMKGKKIKGVGDGSEDGDAVNYKQLIEYIDKMNSLYYYTKELQHNNERIVLFPTIDKYPYESFHIAYPGMSNDIKNALRINKPGEYQIIYTDNYKNPDELATIVLKKSKPNTKNDWAPITIDTVIRFYGGENLTIYASPGITKAILDGSPNGTFFIKYLNS